MNRNDTLIVIILILTGMASVTAFWSVTGAEARCRWVWKGAESYYVCDENRDWRQGVSICDFSKRKGPNGAPRTVTVLCRADGSPWKEVIVGPNRVVVNILGRDGSVVERKKIDISRRGAPVWNTTIAPRRPPEENDRWEKREWQTRVMGVKVKGDVERKGNDIKGVLKFRIPFTGKKKLYVYQGRIDGRQIEGRSGGHTFKGRILDDGKVKGTIKIHNGPSIPFTSPVTLP